MMEKRFERNMGAISAEEQTRLHRCKIFIAGCGGVGGMLLENMARLGVGHITCADSDVFEASNLNRQILALEQTLGQKKAACAAARVRQIWSACDIRAVYEKIDAQNLPRLIEGANLVLDTLDNAQGRLALAAACRDANIPLAHGAASGWQAQAAIIRPDKNLYDLLYLSGQRQKDGVLPFAAAAAAAMQAALAANYLCGRHSDALYMLDLHAMRTETIAF